MEKKNLVFITKNDKGENKENGNRNPWSVPVIEELQQRGCIAIVLDSHDYVPTDETLVVTLFDFSRNVKKRLRPMRKTDKHVPGWAGELSTAWCVAVGEMKVREHVKKAAEYLAAVFSRELRGTGNGGTEPPWGPLPALDKSWKKHQKRRERRARLEKRNVLTRPYPDYNSHR